MKNLTRAWDGVQITQPGIYSGIPLESYHAPNICIGPSISSSGLREIFGENKSPKHFYAHWNGNPNRIEKPESRAFVIGRAVHHLMLGERFFAKLFCVQPDEWPDERGELKPWHNARTVCKAWNAARRKEGRAWLTPKEVESIKQMAISISNHPLVKQGALNGQIERSLFWIDKETGIWLKARPDAIPTDSGDYVDLKTTHSVHWSDLQRTMRDFAYYRQAGLVRAACRRVLDMEWHSFTLIFVEKGTPWCTRDVRCDDEDLHRGDRANRAALRIFAKCLKDNHWLGPGEGNEGNERLPLSPHGREAMDAKLKLEGLADNED